MIAFAVVCVLLVALTRRGIARTACLIHAVPACAFTFLLPTVEVDVYHVYYVAAATVDTGVVLALSYLCATTPLTVALQGAGILSIALNFGGWLLWWAYLPPQIYNSAFVAFYVAVIGLMLTGGGKRGGLTGLFSRTADFFRVFTPMRAAVFKKPK